MKRNLLRLVVSLVLTVPVFLGLSRIDILARWVGSEDVWNAFSPVFHLFGVIGVEGEEDVVIDLLLIVSFIIACVLVWTGSKLLAGHKNKAV